MSRQSFICAADRFLKNGHFVCVSAYLHKENMTLQNRRADKKLRWYATEKPLHTILCVSVYLFSNEITAQKKINPHTRSNLTNSAS
jgi:hypothetical protein